MKKFFAVLMVLTLLTTVFPFTMVEAKSKTVSLTGEIVKISLKESNNNNDVLALKCEGGNYILTGNTKGMKDYIGYTATVNGTHHPVFKGILMFQVKEYKIITKPEPTPVQTQSPAKTPSVDQTAIPEPVVTQVPNKQTELKGILFNPISSKLRFLLKTESATYELMGNTKGMENEYGNTLLVMGNYVYTFAPTEYPLFSVESYTVLGRNEPTPTPTVTPAPTVKTITINDNGGYVYIHTGDEVKLELEANHSTPYDWSYITKPDQDILIETNYEYQEYELYSPDGHRSVGSGGMGIWTYKALRSGTVVIEMAYAPRSGESEAIKTFTVKIIVEDLQTLQGSLTVTKLDDVAEEGPLAYSYLLNTQTGPVTLQGNTKGLEKYNGLNVEVSGSYSMLKIYPPIFIVDSYKLLPTPTPAVKTITMADNGGYVYIKNGDEVKLELETNHSTGYDWSYVRKPDPKVLLETNYEYQEYELYGPDGQRLVGGGGKGIWTYKALKSDIVVIEMAYSRSWESVTPAKTFIVKVIIEETATPTPTVTPEPTPTPDSKTHTIISDKALYISLPNTEKNEVTGFTTISWTEGTDKAFFSSKLNMGKDVYEFELVSAKTVDSESIKGLFSIKKNGEFVAKEITGQLYGLSQPVGSYFKFYSEDMKYHMSAYITNRLDF